MARWTLMKDAVPVASYEFDGSAPEMMNDSFADAVTDFVLSKGAPACVFAPVTHNVVLISGDWCGSDVWQLVREDGHWLPPAHVNFYFQMPMEAGTC